MNKTPVVLLAVLAVAFSAYAEAAKPRKRSRNANRVGAYGSGAIGFVKYTSDASEEEESLLDTLAGQGVPTRNLESNSELNDIGYQATFGYRFNRYFAAELSLVQVGELASTASGELDFGTGFLPTSLKLTFSAGGPLMSAIGILPINDKFEFYGRAGYLFASAEREFSSRVGDQRGGFGGVKGNSQDVVFGAGATYHFNQVYSMRLEYMLFDEIGEEQRTGTEDANTLALGLVVRF